MAKPARVKKNQAAAPAKKGAKKAEKAVSKTGPREEKPKEAKSGLKAKLSKAPGIGAKGGGTKGAGSKGGGPTKEKRSATRFLREVRSEMSKVTWPSREELIQSTLVVVVAVVIAGIFIALLDAGFSRLISLIS